MGAGELCVTMAGTNITQTLSCTSHGFSPEGAVIVHGQPFGQGTGHILMDDVRCWGNESSILQCQHSGWGNHNCDHSKDVSINCTSHKRFMEFTDASVVCRSLGYAWQNASGTCCSLYERMSGPDHCVKVRCNGLEDGLNQCDQTDAKNSYCWQYDVSVKCLSDILQILEFKSSSLVFREGASAWFDLQIQSNAAYQIRWFHNEDLITSSSTRYRITSFEHENGTSSHTLQKSLLNVTQGGLILKKDETTISDVSHSNFTIIWSTSSGTKDGLWQIQPAYTPAIRSSSFVSVDVTVLQPEQKRCEGQISDGISWNTTLAGNTKYEHCPANQRGDAFQDC
uniref:SRCR domain-containing protein n=1 Tax=Magallana gigas TaxID=29159 RepID=A0A8W8JKF0_MAGGI